MRKSILYALLFAILTAFSACHKDDEMPIAKVSVVNDSIKVSYHSVYIISHVDCNATYTQVVLELAQDSSFSNPLRHNLRIYNKEAYYFDTTSLVQNTTYFFRYVVCNQINSIATPIDSFRTMDYSVPEIRMDSVTLDATNSLFTAKATLFSNGGDEIKTAGFCYSLVPNPNIIYNDYIELKYNNQSVLSSPLPDLQLDKTYYVRAYATNSKGVGYSEDYVLSTMSLLPKVETGEISDVQTTSAVVSGRIIYSGNPAYTERGFCWATQPQPTINDNCKSVTGIFDDFNTQIDGLQEKTTYYVCAYAKNKWVVAYGETKAFTTAAMTLPKVKTIDVNNITTTTAMCGGQIESDGGATITAKGVCWSTTSNPTIGVAGNMLEMGSGNDDFSGVISNLSAATTYYIRAYAINSKGVAYGEQKMFTTLISMHGALIGVFSIAETQKIRFSQGNLQYKAKTDTWRFAENQYDMIGEANVNISPTYSGWIDLFGWGTGNNPTKSSTSINDYSTFTDWGVNAISNGGSKSNQWHSLTFDEWQYLFDTRTKASSLRGQATINGVHGYILLPDSWITPSGLSFTATPNNWTTNTYDTESWQIMESAGAVFLPAAGYRFGTEVNYVSNNGYYWSSTVGDGNNARNVNFSEGSAFAGNWSHRNYGRSVRLVQDIK